MRSTFIFLGLAVPLAGCGKPLPPPLNLPSAEQIAEMRASVPHIEEFRADPIPEFGIPLDHVPRVLFWLLPGEPDRFSVSGGVNSGLYFHVADVSIRTNDGRELRLRCHDWGCKA